ncbi:MAG: ATP-binding protein [Spirochaetales bacterium]|nr:ATP-binding protein [Spirochaetales bacterium]
MIERDTYLKTLIGKIDNGMVKILTGIRRSGKSYLLFNIFKTYLLENNIKAENIIEVVLDDDSYIALRNPINLGSYIREKINNNNEKYFVFIDEIQFVAKVKNPYLEGDYISFYEVLNGLLNKGNIDVYVTGSNSKMLSKDILTEFRGRGDQVHIYPLSFSEFYSYCGGDFLDSYDEYSLYGGLPKVALLKSDEDKAKYLKTLYSEVYLKDVIERNNIRKGDELSILTEVLASGIGSYTNSTNLSNTFKSELKVGYEPKSIASHIECLKDSFLLEEAKRFDIKGRKYIGANSKYYFTDIGLRNAMLNFRQNEPTHIMENIIFNELIIMGYNVDVGIVELTTTENGKNKKVQLEVDFIANRGQEKIYIQSAYSLAGEEKQKQEKRSLFKINDSFRKIIIQKDSSKSYYDDNGIYIMSLKDFLTRKERVNY